MIWENQKVTIKCHRCSYEFETTDKTKKLCNDCEKEGPLWGHDILDRGEYG